MGLPLDAGPATVLRETSGPTSLPIGVVTDGQFLKRSGGNIISAAGGGGGGPPYQNAQVSRTSTQQTFVTSTPASFIFDTIFRDNGPLINLGTHPTRLSAITKGVHSVDFDFYLVSGGSSGIFYVYILLSTGDGIQYAKVSNAGSAGAQVNGSFDVVLDVGQYAEIWVDPQSNANFNAECWASIALVQVSP